MQYMTRVMLFLLLPLLIHAQHDPTWGYISKQQADSLIASVHNGTNDTLKMEAFRKLGFYYQEADNDTSLNFHQQQLALATKLQLKLWQADAYSQIAYCLLNAGYVAEAFESFTIANKLAADKKNESSNWHYWNFSNAENLSDARLAILAMNHLMLANLFRAVGDIETEKSYREQTIKIGDSIQNGKILSLGYWLISGYYSPDSSIQFKKKAISYSNNCGYHKFDANIYSAIGRDYIQIGIMDSAKKYITKSLQINEQQNNPRFSEGLFSSAAYLYDKLNNKDSSLYFAKKALEAAQITSEPDDKADAFFRLANVYNKIKNVDSALKYSRLSGSLNDSLSNIRIKKLTDYQKLAFKDQLRLKELEGENALTAARTRSYFLLGGLGVFLLIGLQLVRNNRQKQKVNKELALINEMISEEKQRSDELLLNILPSAVADEIKQHGYSKAKTYSMVTVMFTDFKDFTSVSEKVSAELLVAEIDYCFSAFDNIVQKHRVEKIKTVGDAYICVGGMPALNFTHAIDIINAAIEIRNFMLNRKKEKEAKGEIPFELRIGIHTGPVVAGIVGVKKYAYDIWGDTVNLAARVEQNSEAGKINISESTYELVKDKFTCTHRGKIQAKNKGEINMYFVELST